MESYGGIEQIRNSWTFRAKIVPNFIIMICKWFVIVKYVFIVLSLEGDKYVDALHTVICDVSVGIVTR